jgi:hypothetical protein
MNFISENLKQVADLGVTIQLAPLVHVDILAIADPARLSSIPHSERTAQVFEGQKRNK